MGRNIDHAAFDQAKQRKNDEFYTQLPDIERELLNYKAHFAGKTVYCNCDDPRRSNFYRYFAEHFEELGLKKVIASCISKPCCDLFSPFEPGFFYEYAGSGKRHPNLDLPMRHDCIPLVKKYRGHEAEYPKFDNCDAINVDRTQNIPGDYDGLIGVPITFLHRFNPEQFEIVRFRKGDDGKDLTINGKAPYFRILVRRVQPRRAAITLVGAPAEYGNGEKALAAS